MPEGRKRGDMAPAGNRPVVVIPAYKPLEAFGDFLGCLKSQGDFTDIVVVDDGSGEEYGGIFQAVEDLPGVVVLRHHTNLGKGRALKTAFNYCLGLTKGGGPCAGVITADADGQHRVGDIIRIGRALAGNPEKLVLGSRAFGGQDIPLRSRFGNTVSRLVYRWLCGVNVSDTQTGLRGIPCGFLEECCGIEGERYEYETNMLLKAKELDIRFTEIPIETVYENSNSGSHFNPLRDSLKIYSVIFKYSLSSILSVVIDYLVFYYLYGKGAPVLAATYAARIGSSLVNFGINRKVVFKNNGNFAAQFCKYLLLVLLSGTLSGTGIGLLKKLFGLPATITKVAVELALYFMNFYVQRIWVFSSKCSGQAFL